MALASQSIDLGAKAYLQLKTFGCFFSHRRGRRNSFSAPEVQHTLPRCPHLLCMVTDPISGLNSRSGRARSTYNTCGVYPGCFYTETPSSLPRSCEVGFASLMSVSQMRKLRPRVIRYLAQVVGLGSREEVRFSNPARLAPESVPLTPSQARLRLLRGFSSRRPSELVEMHADPVYVTSGPKTLPWLLCISHSIRLLWQVPPDL